MEENRLTAEYVGEVISDAQTKDEKEKECTDKIVQLAKEIVNIYREYNPDGNYLNICFLGEGLIGDGMPTSPALSIHNNHWEDSFKINHMEEVCNGN